VIVLVCGSVGMLQADSPTLPRAVSTPEGTNGGGSRRRIRWGVESSPLGEGMRRRSSGLWRERNVDLGIEIEMNRGGSDQCLPAGRSKVNFASRIVWGGAVGGKVGTDHRDLPRVGILDGMVYRP
jgi:hypothetical protein